MERDLTLTWVGRARSSRAGPPVSYRGLFKASFSSSAADSRISRESLSPLTARAIETPPTTAGQAGGLDEVRAAPAMDPGFSEARGGYLHDAVVAFSLVRLGMAHQ